MGQNTNINKMWPEHTQQSAHFTNNHILHHVPSDPVLGMQISNDYNATPFFSGHSLWQNTNNDRNDLTAGAVATPVLVSQKKKASCFVFHTYPEKWESACCISHIPWEMALSLLYFAQILKNGNQLAVFRTGSEKWQSACILHRFWKMANGNQLVFCTGSEKQQSACCISHRL